MPVMNNIDCVGTCKSVELGQMNDWLTTAFSCYHESKILRQCFFGF